MTEQVPLISIGLPVYNGAATLARALDSLLAQSVADFELIIDDDCSVDETPVLCQRYAAGNSRIRYTRNSRNLGSRGNLNQVAHKARGRYFLYASQDDIWSPVFFERLIGALESPPGAVAAMCAYDTIYPDGEPAGVVRVPREDFPQRHGNLANAIAVLTKRGRRMRPLKTNNFIHGLVRTDAFLDCLRSLPVVFTNERQFVCLLALAGRLVQVDEMLFTKQITRENLYDRQPDDPLVLTRQAARFPQVGYAWTLIAAVFRSRIIPLRRKPYLVPLIGAFWWETVVQRGYSHLLVAIRRAAPPTLFIALRRLLGQR